MSVLKKFLFAIASVMFASNALAFGMVEVETILQQPQAVSGTFTQKRHLRSLSAPLVGSGTFVLLPQKALLWQTEKPFADTVRVSARGVEQYSAATKRWLKGGQSAAQVKIFLGLLGGDSRALRQQFKVAVTGDARRWQMVLTPNTALSTQIFTAITVSGDSVVRSIELKEKQGDRSEIAFEAVRVNPTLSPADRAALSF